MKFMTLRKDGGQESRVWGFFFIEIKPMFSIVLLHFKDGSRDAYHSHAFNAISWVFKGELQEHELQKESLTVYNPSPRPIFTPRTMFHKVVSKGDTWALSLRGPWIDTWKEYLPKLAQYITLTHGRQVVA